MSLSQAPPCSFMTAAIWHRRYKNNHLPNQFGQEVYKEEPVWSSPDLTHHFC